MFTKIKSTLYQTYYKNKLKLYKYQTSIKRKKLKKIIIDNLNIYKNLYTTSNNKTKSKLDFLINYGIILTDDYFTYRINDTNSFKPVKDPYLLKNWDRIFIIKDITITELINDKYLLNQLYMTLKM